MGTQGRGPAATYAALVLGQVRREGCHQRHAPQRTRRGARGRERANKRERGGRRAKRRRRRRGAGGRMRAVASPARGTGSCVWGARNRTLAPAFGVRVSGVGRAHEEACVRICACVPCRRRAPCSSCRPWAPRSACCARAGCAACSRTSCPLPAGRRGVRRQVPCEIKREGGQSLVTFKGKEGCSLVMSKGRGGKPLGGGVPWACGTPRREWIQYPWSSSR